MSGLVALLMFSALQAQPVDLCAVRAGEVPAGTKVAVEGRFVSDFMHFSGLTRTDGSCQTGWSWDSGVYATETGRKFYDATWGVAGLFPRTSETEFWVKALGEVRRTDEGRYFVWVTELSSFAIEGVIQ